MTRAAQARMAPKRWPRIASKAASSPITKGRIMTIDAIEGQKRALGNRNLTAHRFGKPVRYTPVVPAKAGLDHERQATNMWPLDSGFRRNDEGG